MCCSQSVCLLDEQYFESYSICLMIGRRTEAFDDLRTDNGAPTSSSTSSFVSTFPDGRCLYQERINFQMGGASLDSKVTNGIIELLGLLRILGEGYRLSCLYRSQVCYWDTTIGNNSYPLCIFVNLYNYFWHEQDAVDVYLKLSQHQYNTGWVLSQVITVWI